jgi:hypothetical protein
VYALPHPPRAPAAAEGGGAPAVAAGAGRPRPCARQGVGRRGAATARAAPRRPSIEGAVDAMCQDLIRAGRLFPPSEAMCQIQVRRLALHAGVRMRHCRVRGAGVLYNEGVLCIPGGALHCRVAARAAAERRAQCRTRRAVWVLHRSGGPDGAAMWRKFRHWRIGAGFVACLRARWDSPACGSTCQALGPDPLTGWRPGAWLVVVQRWRACA